MALHPSFSRSPYAELIPEQRWFPADETLRSTAYEKLLPPLVAKVRQEVFAWRKAAYSGASATSVALLTWWFETEHLQEEADGSLSPFRYYFAQREAVETIPSCRSTVTTAATGATTFSLRCTFRTMCVLCVTRGISSSRMCIGLGSLCRSRFPMP